MMTGKNHIAGGYSRRRFSAAPKETVGKRGLHDDLVASCGRLAFEGTVMKSKIGPFFFSGDAVLEFENGEQHWNQAVDRP